MANFVNQEGGQDGNLTFDEARAHVTGLKLQGPDTRPIQSDRALGDIGIGVFLFDSLIAAAPRSRVAIMGPNGAGKSTVAGLVVGELAPDSGTAYRHPTLGALAREEEQKTDTKAFRLSEGQLVLCAPDHPQALEPEMIVDRRQRGRLGYEYEMRWRGRTTTSWMSRSQVSSMGCLGMAKREDERQAAQRSLSARPLTTPAVQAHLAGFGLSKEEASFRRLGALSSGQRARAVLAASTWLAPHLLVLDEPTNYLDQPALAALAAGLKIFGGGVLIISHTASFVDEAVGFMLQGL
eukprot:s3241_g1.t1